MIGHGSPPSTHLNRRFAMLEASAVALDTRRCDGTLARRASDRYFVRSLRMLETDEVSPGVFHIKLIELKEPCDAEEKRQVETGNELQIPRVDVMNEERKDGHTVERLNREGMSAPDGNDASSRILIVLVEVCEGREHDQVDNVSLTFRRSTLDEEHMR